MEVIFNNLVQTYWLHSIKNINYIFMILTKGKWNKIKIQFGFRESTIYRWFFKFILIVLCYFIDLNFLFNKLFKCFFLLLNVIVFKFRHVLLTFRIACYKSHFPVSTKISYNIAVIHIF